VDPFAGQRWNNAWPERIAWHVFTIGVLGLLLLVLLISIDSLGERTANAESIRAAIPVRVEAVEPRTSHSSVRLPGVVQPGARVELGFRVDSHIARFRAEEGQRLGRISAGFQNARILMILPASSNANTSITSM
jgi:multidrug efflux pump subunit AcrA (membrane-fusion protein)